MIKSAPYIFEGIVIQEKYYDGKNQVVSTEVLQITKIYKGNPELKLGSIKIIGGHAIRYDSINIASEREGMGLRKGGRYILFCKPANPSWAVDSTATTNTLILTRMDCCNYPVIFDSKNGAQWGYSKYNTTDSLYSFFKENGLTVQEEVEQKK